MVICPCVGLFSLLFSGGGVIVNDWSAIRADGFFQGYSFIVAIVILLQVSFPSVCLFVMALTDLVQPMGWLSYYSSVQFFN